MFQRLLTWTVFVALWRRYGKLLRIFPVIVVLVFLISMLHGDYVQYVQVSDDASFLPWSFLIKWLLILLVLGAYWRFAVSVIQGDKASGKRKVKNDNANLNSGNIGQKGNTEQDPFRNIREKKELRTKAEVVLKKKP